MSAAGQKGILKLLWETYYVDVMPADAPPVQVQECRRAFYGGAQALFMVLGAERGDVEESDAALGKELEDFAKAVLAGKA